MVAGSGGAAPSAPAGDGSGGAPLVTSDPTDPDRDAVYAAEDAVLAVVGPRLGRWRDVETYLDSVLADPGYSELFPDAPIEVVLDRRSRSARASLALPDHATILIRDGSWNALTVLHELAHLAAPGSPAHGPRFVTAELALVCRFCGIEAYVALRTALVAHGIDID